MESIPMVEQIRQELIQLGFGIYSITQDGKYFDVVFTSKGDVSRAMDTDDFAYEVLDYDYGAEMITISLKETP